MKKLFLLGIVATLISSLSFAKVWRVNSNIGVNANFATAQAAHDGASAGDTLYFEHSPVNYGNLNMTKRLTLIGIGAFSNIHPTQQYNINTATITGLTFSNMAAAGSIVMSLHFQSLTVEITNIIISRCFISNGSLTFRGAANCTVTNCYVSAGTYFESAYDTSQIGNDRGCNNLLFTNNIFTSDVRQYNSSTGYTEFYKPGRSCPTCPLTYFQRHNNINFYNNTILGQNIKISGVIVNNIINVSAINSTFRTDASGSVSNNIFCNPLTSITRETVINNTIMVIPFEGGNANQYSIPISNTLTLTGQADTSYMLKLGSAAIGAGINGVDCGATGGNTPYRYGLQPVIPAIYKFRANAVVSGNTIQATVSTRSNN